MGNFEFCQERKNYRFLVGSPRHDNIKTNNHGLQARASSGEEDSGDDQEEESPQPIKRKASRQAVFDEEDSGDEDAQPLAQAKRQKLGKADKPPGKKSKTAAAEESSQDIEIGAAHLKPA